MYKSSNVFTIICLSADRALSYSLKKAPLWGYWRGCIKRLLRLEFAKNLNLSIIGYSTWDKLYILYLLMILMILIEFIKNALMYPPILKEYAIRLLYTYNYGLFLLLICILLYVVIKYIVLRVSKRKSEITKSVDENWNNINYSFLKSLWHILLERCGFLKYVIIWFVISNLGWLFVSIFFFISAWYNKVPGVDANMIKDYSTHISSYSWLVDKNFFLSMQFIQEHNTTLSFMLWLTAVYCLICFLLWWFFVTFSFGNKFVRNIGVAFVILSVLIFFLWKLLDFYVIR